MATPVTFNLIDAGNNQFYSRIYIAPLSYPVVYSGSIVVGDVVNVITNDRSPTKTITLLPNDYEVRCIGTPDYQTQFYISVVDTNGIAVSASAIINSGPITSSNFTASYAITASYALNGGGGGATSSWASSSISSSWATTASYAVSALTASYALNSGGGNPTSSWATNAITASWATTASHAVIAGSLVTSSNYQVNILTASSEKLNFLTTNYINFTGSNPSYAEGTIFYDSANHTLCVWNDQSTTKINLAEDEYVRAVNKTGAIITNGSAVTISSSQGNRPQVILAQSGTATASLAYGFIGLAAHDIAINQEGLICTLGVVDSINTTAFNAGDTLYVSSSAGKFTNTRPAVPYDIMKVGIALNSTVNGSILVKGVDATHYNDLSGYVASTGSLYGTSSWATNAITSSWATTASYAVSALTASYALNSGGGNPTSSWATNAITASWATTASHAVLAGSLVTSSNYKVNILTASLVSSSNFTGNLTGTSSYSSSSLWSNTSGVAATASYLLATYAITQQLTASNPSTTTVYTIADVYYGYATEVLGPYPLVENNVAYEFRVYAYRDTPNGRLYSTNPYSIAVSDNDTGQNFQWSVNWDSMPSADGYRILVSDPNYPANLNYYRDTAYNQMDYDGTGLTAGNTVTPTGSISITTINTALKIAGDQISTGSLKVNGDILVKSDINSSQFEFDKTTGSLKITGNTSSVSLLELNGAGTSSNFIYKRTASSASSAISFSTNNTRDFYISNVSDGTFRIASDSDNYIVLSSSKVGIGHAAPSAELHVISTTEQQRIGYNTSNYLSNTINSNGSATFDLVGTSPTFTYKDSIILSGSITGTATASFPKCGINSTAFTVGAEESLLISGSTYNIATALGNIDGYVQFNVKNNSAGGTSSADLCVTNNAGTENGNYVNMGINSTNHTTSTDLGGPNDAYVYATGSDFYVGNISSAKKLYLFTGGTNNSSSTVSIDSSKNMTVAGNISASSYSGSAATIAGVISCSAVSASGITVTSAIINGNISASSFSGSFGWFPLMIQIPYSSSAHAVTTTVTTGSTYYKVSDNRLYTYNGSRWMSSSAYG